MTINLSPFGGIFGLPPRTYVSDTLILNSMPVMEIIPGEPNFESGLTLFRVDDAWKTYTEILGKHGFTLSQRPLKLAYIADNFPTDSFTNEYGETFLQSLTDVASSGMQQLVQISGQRSGIAGGKALGTGLAKAGTDTGGLVGGVLEGVGTGAVAAFDALEKLKNSLGSQSDFMKKSLDTIDAMIGGARVDYPQIWKNSGYTPSYTATVRLYNPNPGSSDSTKHHIIGPLAAILCLAIPRSGDGKTFNWPFFHKIKSKGIYGLDPSVITNITVVKGGDQQQISFNKKLAMVDVRIDITSLYGTMVLDEKSIDYNSSRPTVAKYLQSLGEDSKKGSEYYTRNQMNEASGKSAGILNQGPNVIIKSNFDEGPFSREFIAKNEAAKRMKAQTVTDSQGRSRISPTLVALNNQLIGEAPGGVYT
jgi:hypothetical protein